MKRDITFGYVVSTVESKLLENVGFTNQLAKINDPIVIVNQFQDRPLEASFLGQHVQVINSKTRGLSRSRNIALHAIEADFVMICDDDISLVTENVERIKKEIQKNPDAALYFTQLQKTTGELWRANYEKDAFSINSLSFNSKRRIQRINSMEQVYNLNFLKANQLVFNVDFGTGSGKFQLGEETLMSWSILKSGGTLQYLPIVARVHPPISSGSIFSAQNARAVLAAQWRVFGLLSFITFSGFLLKSFLRFVNQKRSSRA